MRKFISIIVFGSLFAGCANTPAPKSHREILQSIIPMTARLDGLAMPLRKAGADFCGERVGDDGVILHSLIDYPKLYRPVAKSLWSLGEEDKILYVRPDSAAHKSGLKFGGKYDASQLKTVGTDCAYDVRVRIDGLPNAYANGDSMFVTTGLLENIDDLPLSLIIAHELAHNALGHVGEEISTDNEQAADKWAVFILARAGLDYEKAVLDPKSIGENEDAQKRVSNFEKVIAEIKKLLEQDLPLVP